MERRDRSERRPFDASPRERQEMTTHAAEHGHYYDVNGKPVWEVPSADGKRMISPDVRHARKHGLYPGVTSIIKCAAAPGLQRWIEEQLILSALTLPKIADEPGDASIKRVRDDAGAQAKAARERGTAIHAAIQGHYQGEAPDADLWEHVKAVRDCIEGMVGTGWQWTAERSFSHSLGFGGKVDLSSPWWVIDVKGTETITEGMKTWEEHHMQLAAYREGLGLPKARCGIVYAERDKPKALFVEVSEDELVRGWGMFQGLLAFWRAKNRIDK